jgi:hypothetical protein
LPNPSSVNWGDQRISSLNGVEYGTDYLAINGDAFLEAISFKNPVTYSKSDYVEKFYDVSETLANKLGYGATAEEILAMSANESTWGASFKASDFGNYFGLHNIASGPYAGQTGSYLTSGKDGVFGTVQDRWFAPTSGPKIETPIFGSDGYFYSGMVLVNRLGSSFSGTAASDPRTFFGAAFDHGWGLANKDPVDRSNYVDHMMGVYNSVVRAIKVSKGKSL